jgi:hypothetical protein
VVAGDVVMPDFSSPAGFLLGLLVLACILALVHAFLRFLTSRSSRSSDTDQLAYELSRIATALECLVLQRQEASTGELQPDAPLEQSPLNIPNPVYRPDEAEQQQPDEEPKKSGTIPLSMFGRGR